MQDAELLQIIEFASKEIALCKSREELLKVKSSFLGKDSALHLIMKTLKGMSPDERKKLGSSVKEVKKQIECLHHDKLSEIEKIELDQALLAEKVDITLPVDYEILGKKHTLNKAMNELINILHKKDFILVDGCDIEDDFHVFDALNIPPMHPARQMQDTFYLNAQDESNKPYLLRTHTSSVQIRAMQDYGLPLRIMSCGPVYRSDWDNTHTPMFHQIEGLYIDKDVNMANLKWCLRCILEEFFLTNIQMSFRPSFFPFTEPSAEVDINYEKVNDRIHIGAGDEMLEVLGCGMVHPDIIKRLGLDNTQYQGFAFGLGVERLAMLKFGITDLRSFFDIDLRVN